MISKQQQNLKTIFFAAIFMVLCLTKSVCLAQDDSYDDEGYGNQGGNNNQGDSDSYGPANDDGYSNNNSVNQQQNLDSEGTNNQPQGNNYNIQSNNDADDDYQGDDNTAASSLKPTITRIKRSIKDDIVKFEGPLTSSASESKHRVKRHSKHYIGPVYTYVKTDKHANFKWGVKHKVGKKHHG